MYQKQSDVSGVAPFLSVFVSMNNANTDEAVIPKRLTVCDTVFFPLTRFHEFHGEGGNVSATQPPPPFL